MKKSIFVFLVASSVLTLSTSAAFAQAQKMTKGDGGGGPIERPDPEKVLKEYEDRRSLNDRIPPSIAKDIDRPGVHIIDRETVLKEYEDRHRSDENAIPSSIVNFDTALKEYIENHQ